MTRVEAFHDGDFASAAVLVDGQRLEPRPSQRVWNRSPDRFAWGYGGSGPAQLALAPLIHAGLHPAAAIRLHQRFKDEFIAARRQNERWVLEVDVLASARSKQASEGEVG